MLPRNHRLTAKRDFERVSRGRPVHAPYFTVRIAENRLATVRIGIVAGLKVSKRAVDRNRVKRILRELFQRNILALHPGIDIVIHAKSTAVGIPTRTMSDILGKTLARAGALVRPWTSLSPLSQTPNGVIPSATRNPTPRMRNTDV